MGTSFYGYTQTIADAFQGAGVRATAIPYPNVRSGWHSLPSRVGISAYEDRVRRRVLRQTLEGAHDSDLVLMVRGDFFAPEDVARIRSQCGVPIALWAIDSIYRMRCGPALCRSSDVVFLYNSDEVEQFSLLGKPAFFAPLGYDPHRYYPIETVAQDVDVYYVGTFHSTRKVLLNDLIGRLGDGGFKIAVDGRVVPPYRPLLAARWRREFPHLWRCSTNRQVTHEHINRMTNRAKLCLNWLPEQATSALNTRAFEICGSGGFQMVSKNNVLGGLFEVGKEIETFADAQELEARVRYYLTSRNEPRRRSIASRGHRRASLDHTYDQRVREVIAQLESVL